jgi:integrase
MMARRANHEGTIAKRDDGRWQGRIQVGGKRVSVYGKTRADVVGKLDELRAAPILASPNPALLLNEWVAQWLLERELRASSQDTYKKVLKRILDDLGHVKLTQLNTMMLSLQFSLLRERGMGARRLQLAHGYLKSCLGRALELGLLKTNPMDAVKRPKWEPTTKDFWTLEETRKFMDTCVASPRRYAPLFLLLIATGLRMSEVLALEEGGPILQITAGEVWVQSQGYVSGDVKTKSSG